MVDDIFLPLGSEERGVLGVGSIPVAIPSTDQDMKMSASYLHKHEDSRVVKHTKHLRGHRGSTSVYRYGETRGLTKNLTGTTDRL